MTDLTSPFLIKLKGWLFLLIGCAASGLLVYEAPSLRIRGRARHAWITSKAG